MNYGRVPVGLHVKEGLHVEGVQIGECMERVQTGVYVEGVHTGLHVRTQGLPTDADETVVLVANGCGKVMFVSIGCNTGVSLRESLSSC